MKKYSLLVVAGFLALTCIESRSADLAPTEHLSAQSKTAVQVVQGQGGRVVETMDAGGYTYVLVDTGSKQIWAAAPEFEVRIGDEVVVPDGMIMKDFTSKTLGRTFTQLLFVGEVMVSTSGTPVSSAGGTPQTAGAAGMHGKPVIKPQSIDLTGLEKAGQSIEEIFTSQDDLAGKEISVRGKVVKFSPQIMKTNWLHLQDGSGSAGSNDLVVTTDSVVDTGDTVLITGVLSVNKDFGFGYQYDVIVEGAQVTVE